jgi:Uma2 family endonuclease
VDILSLSSNLGNIPSVQEYVLVSTEEIHIESFLRKGEEWNFQESKDGEKFRFQSMDIELNLKDVYEKVTFTQKKLRQPFS